MSNYFTDDDEKLKWNCGPKKSLLKTIVFDVTSSTNTCSNGDRTVSGEYIVLDAPDWVIVIPEDRAAADGQKFFYMVKQWRHGSKCLSVEFPGGVIDKGEDPETAARRELLEEVNTEIEKPVYIGFQLVDEENGTPEYAQVRMAALIRNIGKKQPDPDNGKTYDRLMVAPECAAVLLQWGDVGYEQIMRA